MIKLETTTGTILSKILKEIFPIEYSSNRQVNQLIDGSYHVQIIGSPVKSMKGTFISTFNQAETLNRLVDEGASLLLTLQGKKYLVYIDESIPWRKINSAHGDRDKSFLEGKFTAIIKEEVTL